MKKIEVHGYAIVSEDDRIADTNGAMPPALQNDADWAYFQAELDRADWVALGRVSHEAMPNPKRRRRLVLSRQARGLERRAEAMWWNPLAQPWSEVGAALLPNGGRVATPGGQAAFDVFLAIGFNAFHLTRMRGVRLPGGRGLFAACDRGARAASVLAAAGLMPEAARTIDAAADVTLTVWRAENRRVP